SSYPTRPGTSTSMDFLTVVMSTTPPLLCSGSGACWRSPFVSRPSRRAALSPREASESALGRRDCGERNVTSSASGRRKSAAIRVVENPPCCHILPPRGALPVYGGLVVHYVARS